MLALRLLQDKQVLALRLVQDKRVLALRRVRDKLRLVRGKQELVLHDQCAEVHILRAVPLESVLHLLGIQVRHDQCAEAHTLRAVLHGLQGPAQTEYQALA